MNERDKLSHYTLGRFLGIAQMVKDPDTWQMSHEQIITALIEISDEYIAEVKRLKEAA